MSLDLPRPVELVAYFDNELNTLQARAQRLAEQLSGRSLKSDFTKLAGVQMELETVNAEIARLTDERAQAQAELIEQRRAAAQRENAIAEHRRRYAAVSRELAEELRVIHAARLALIDYGEQDPGDRQISAEAIAGPIIERDRRILQEQLVAERRGRATSEELAASHRRRDMETALINGGRTHEEAKAIVAFAEDKGIDDPDEAIRRYFGADDTEEETDNAVHIQRERPARPRRGRASQAAGAALRDI